MFFSLPADVLDAPPQPGIWFNLEMAVLQNLALKFGASRVDCPAKRAEKRI